MLKSGGARPGEKRRAKLIIFCHDTELLKTAIIQSAKYSSNHLTNQSKLSLHPQESKRALMPPMKSNNSPRLYLLILSYYLVVNIF